MAGFSSSRWILSQQQQERFHFKDSRPVTAAVDCNSGWETISPPYKSCKFGMAKKKSEHQEIGVMGSTPMKLSEGDVDGCELGVG